MFRNFFSSFMVENMLLYSDPYRAHVIFNFIRTFYKTTSFDNNINVTGYLCQFLKVCNKLLHIIGYGRGLYSDGCMTKEMNIFLAFHNIFTVVSCRYMKRIFCQIIAHLAVRWVKVIRPSILELFSWSFSCPWNQI